MDMRKWFKEAQYGMMVHWGLYSLLAGEWKGKRCGQYAEWIQANRQIPISEYEKLAKAFNPVFFNAEEWEKLCNVAPFHKLSYKKYTEKNTKNGLKTFYAHILDICLNM